MDALLKLINSLSASEKRHFKKNIVIHTKGKTNSYLKLFNYLSEQKEYNLNDIKTYFAKEKFINNFPAIKKYLWEAIIKSLKSSTIEKSINTIIREKVESSEVLLNKSLHKSALKTLKQAKKIAITYEKHSLLLTILELEKEIIRLSGNWNFENTNFQEELDLSNKILEYYEYEQLTFKLNKTISAVGVLNISEAKKKEINSVLNSPLIKQPSEHNSLKSKIIFELLIGKKHMYNYQWDLSKKHLNNAKILFDNSTSYKQENKIQYSHLLINILLVSEHSLDNKLRSETINTLKQFSKTLKGYKNDMFYAGIFRVISMSELEWHIKNNIYENIEKVLSETETGLQIHGNKISERGQQMMYYLIAYIYLVIGKFEESINFSNIILNNYRTAPRKDLYVSTFILHLISNYHLGITTYLNETSNSLARYIRNHKLTDSDDLKIIYHLKKIVAIKNKYSNINNKLITKLCEKILLDTKKETLISSYFDFKTWLLATKENKSYLQVLLATQK